MLALSKWFQQISHCEAKLSISAFLSSFRNIPYSTCRNCNLFRRQSYVNSRWSFNKNFNVFLLASSPLQMCRNYRLTNCCTSIQDAVFWIWPVFTIVNNSIGSYQSLSIQASPSEEEVAVDLLNQILSAIENDPMSSREIFTTCIDKLCRDRNLLAAARLLQSLRDRHIYLSPNAYNLLLEAAGEGNDTELVLQIFKDLFMSSVSMSSTSYLNLAKAFRNKTDCVLLLRFVKELSELIFPRSATVVNRIIYAFAECGQIDKALMIFDHMKSLKCKPDLVTYNTVLGLLGRVGRIDEMLHEFASMKEASIIPDIISYNTLLNSLQKVGRLDMCLVLLKEMEERGLEPDLRTYTAMIESFGQTGNIEESFRLFDEMKRKHIRPSIYIYRALIYYSKKMGKLELAMNLLEELNTRHSDLVGPWDFKRKRR